MLKTLEAQVTSQAPTPALQAEFAQHDFERLRGFCSLIYLASLGIWLLFDLIVSFIGAQGFTWMSLLFIASLTALVILQRFVRQARHFDLLNLVFVAVIALGIRLVIEGLPQEQHAVWQILAASSILYSASVLPLSRWSFLCAVGVCWVVLDPFFMTGIVVYELKGALILSYSLFLTGITLYSFFRLRQAKLHNHIMAGRLLEQAYIDALTAIPNRRSFMSKTQQHLRTTPQDHAQYLAMIDVDNFKKVNDVHGHDVGDEVLKRVAADIRTVMGDFEYARLGGEEFAVYLHGMPRIEAEALMARLCRRVREAMTEYPVTISIGLARIEPQDTLNSALVKADQALYSSKHSGKDRYTFFE
ncbi:GGDEF domain-containing protein [Pseudomonas asplenii]|uniref:GGDEF domain-containing protein n=1 Tax=Pseudomonas asplenii TaxID=53407 RepID=UPI00235EB717|nr:GGDEF domain-containing protein [Pseudomonas asplenii]